MKHKQATLLCVFVFSIVTAYTQQAEKFNPEKDKREINGYTIRLVPMPANTFGFFIMKGKKPIYSQLSDPFSHKPTGFKNKEDAYKLAEWVVGEDSETGRVPMVIPASVAKQLNLQSTNTQQQ
jgi:hypothetical protein